MDFASVGCVVGFGPANPEMSRGPKIAREGKPLVGIGIAEESHGSPRFREIGGWRRSCGMGFHVSDSSVYGPQGSAVPESHQQDACPNDQAMMEYNMTFHKEKRSAILDEEYRANLRKLLKVT